MYTIEKSKKKTASKAKLFVNEIHLVSYRCQLNQTRPNQGFTQTIGGLGGRQQKRLWFYIAQIDFVYWTHDKNCRNVTGVETLLMSNVSVIPSPIYVTLKWIQPYVKLVRALWSNYTIFYLKTFFGCMLRLAFAINAFR